MMNKKPLELYLHIPFCARKCAYCDFLSFPATRRMQMEYVEKLIQEIEKQSTFAADYEVVSIFFGGGTPSVLLPSEIVGLMEAIRNHFHLSAQAEVTMEANPGTVKSEGLETMRQAGINRISLGLQSADDRELSYLGRIHTFDEFLKTYQRVRMAGFDNINVDLMSAIPGQTVESWKNTLKKVAMLKPEHISAYSLIVEEGTPYYERYGTYVDGLDNHLSPEDLKKLMALPDLPDEDTEREMYDLTRSFLKDQGYERYEISNYARPGFECSHNVGYWTGVEYLGLGLGSSSYIGGYRFHNTADYMQYRNAGWEADAFEASFRQDLQKLNTEEQMEEFMFLGLRLTRGVSCQEFYARFGLTMGTVYGSVLAELEKDGLLEYGKGNYRLTLRGVDLSNYAMSRFLLS